jgi:Disulphide bond corrector protein DsbC
MAAFAGRPHHPELEAAVKRSPTRLAAVVLLAALVFGCDRPAVTGTGANPADTPVTPTAPSAADRPEDAPPAGIVTEQPGPAQPVVVGAALRPANVRPGQTLTLFVQARTAPTWHIYGTESSAGEAIPTTLRLKRAEGVEPVGSWMSPPAKPAADGPASHYEGTVTFRHQFRVAAGAAPGPLDVTCEFAYQACDPFHCRPPAKVVLKAGAEVVAQD